MGALFCKTSDPLIEILYRERSSNLAMNAIIFESTTTNESEFFIIIKAGSSKLN